MVYAYCVQCAARRCQAEDSHRVQRLVQYRADFSLGGRYGRRIRKLFPTRKDAEAFEYVTLADFKRGTFLPTNKSRFTFSEFFKEYQERHLKLYQKGHAEVVYRLRRFEEMVGGHPLHTIALRNWEKYIAARMADGIAPTTLNRDLVALKSMFGWAVANKFLPANPLKDARRFKVEVVRVRWLSDSEITNILSRCTNAGDLDMRDILVFALNTGFRKSNLVRVTAADINNNRVQAVKTKSNKAYEVPISQILGNLLNRLVGAHPSGRLLNFTNFRRRFSAVIQDSTVTLHTFRHTFAAQCLKKGIPIDRVCAWMGHHSMEFTRTHYGHLAPSQEAIEIELLNLGGNCNDRKATYPDHVAEVL